MYKGKKKINLFNVILVVIFILLAFYALSLIALLLWGLLTSFKSIIDFSDLGNVLGLPDAIYSQKEVTGYNYYLVFQSFTFPIADKSYISSIFGKIECPETMTSFVGLLLNTIAFAGVGSIIHVLTTVTVAYICAKYKFKFFGLLYNIALISMIIPIVGSYPSEIKILQDLGLYNTIIGMWVQKLNYTAGIYFFVFYAFFVGMSDSYIEAAEIDGASQFATYVTIALPLASKIIGTILLLTFVENWNNYQVPLLYFPSIPTLAFGVYSVSTQVYNPNPAMKGAWGAPQKIAACMTLAIPLIIIFVVFRNRMLGDISFGGVKE